MPTPPPPVSTQSLFLQGFVLCKMNTFSLYLGTLELLALWMLILWTFPLRNQLPCFEKQIKRPHKGSGQKSLLVLIPQPPQLRCQNDNEETILVSCHQVDPLTPAVPTCGYCETPLPIPADIIEQRSPPTPLFNF